MESSNKVDDLERRIADTVKVLSAHPATRTGANMSAPLVQLLHLAALSLNIQRHMLVVETGFNIGCSAAAFLLGNKKVRVISFDLGGTERVRTAKKILDGLFPKRHDLIEGDSRKTLPAFIKQHPRWRAGLVYIDGGHSYSVARSDILQARRLADTDATVVMDDVMWWPARGIRPWLAWNQMRLRGIIEQRQRAIFRDDRGERTGYALGRYR